MVEYSGAPEIVGKDLNLHFTISSEPATTLALEYAYTEVSSNCNKKEVILACTDYTFISKASGKSEEVIRKSTLAEDVKEIPEGKGFKIDVSPRVGTSGAVL